MKNLLYVLPLVFAASCADTSKNNVKLQLTNIYTDVQQQVIACLEQRQAQCVKNAETIQLTDMAITTLINQLTLDITQSESVAVKRHFTNLLKVILDSISEVKK